MITMNPIQGTDFSFNIVLSALKARDTQDKVAFAAAKLELDAQKALGQDLVKMIENLGSTIDLYV